MSRIRSIKPEFFRHETLQDLEVAHPGAHPMLVFAGLWTECDKQGVFPWRPRQLHLDILPFIDFDFEEALKLLEDVDEIRHFTAEDGHEYGFIPTFNVHQRISGEEKTASAKYPEPSLDAKTQKHDRSKEEACQKQDGSTSGGGSCPGKGKGKGVGSRDITGAPEIAPVTAEGEFPDDIPFDEPALPATPVVPKPATPQPDPLYEPIWKSMLGISKAFSNYKKEGEACKRLCKMIRIRSPDAPEKTAQRILATFKRLRETGNSFWAGQPFTPSALSASGVFDRVWVEYEKQGAEPDIDWARKLAERDAREAS